MKKISFLIAFMMLSFLYGQAQGETNFGVTGGFLLGSADVSIGGVDIGNISDDLEINDGAGFYIGLLANLGLTEKLFVQPEVLYGNIDGEGVLIVPVMAKYYIADQFSIQAGPQIDILLDVPDLVDEAIKKSGFSLAFGAGYDINDNFAVQAKYSVGLSNRLDNNLADIIGDLGFLGSFLNPEAKTNTLQVGLVYKFN